MWCRIIDTNVSPAKIYEFKEDELIECTYRVLAGKGMHMNLVRYLQPSSEGFDTILFEVGRKEVQVQFLYNEYLVKAVIATLGKLTLDTTSSTTKEILVLDYIRSL